LYSSALQLRIHEPQVIWLFSSCCSS
jgi:hypothetical protein